MATFYDGAENLLGTDKSHMNQQYHIGADETIEHQTQRYRSVTIWADGSKYCFAYVTVIRDNDLLVENVTREDCGGGA